MYPLNIYTYGSLEKVRPIIGALVMHSPTSTTTYIDTSSQDETHTIILAELVVIHVTLDNYKMMNGSASL
jgi:hypothetical protein